MLNSLINIDLHIHSAASAYKEPAGVVEQSNSSNIDVLLRALAAHDISLFSITDHNRFDSSLYIDIIEALAKDDCACKAKVIAGVEFDVQFDDTKPAGHIIAIFNAKTIEELKSIESAIELDLLQQRDDSYTLVRFEALLKTIKLNTILIAHQHSGFWGMPKVRSLTAATDEAIGLYRVGYIDALEYNKPNVQGMLRNELTQLELPAKMLIGSDCHDWTVYPCHDSDSCNEGPFCAQIRALPSFKGLLMALTSPKTRIGCADYEMKPEYIPSIEICGRDVPLSPGINVIIGENGIGKSSLLHLMAGKRRQPAWIKRMEKDLGFSFAAPPIDEIAFIEQGQLQKDYGENGGVFEDSLFAEIGHDEFDVSLMAFAGALKGAIKANIARVKKTASARNAAFRIDATLEGPTYSFNVSCSEDFTEVENKWHDPVETLSSILRSLKLESARTDIYSDEELKKLNDAHALISEVHQRVKRDSEALFSEAAVRSVIANAIRKYLDGVTMRSSDEDRAKASYRKRREEFVDAVEWLVQDSVHESPQAPSFTVSEESGVSVNISRGFKFVRKAKYAESQDLVEDFLQSFNSDFRSLDALLSIETERAIRSAIPRCPESSTLEQAFDDLVAKFSKAQKEYVQTIMEVDNTATGNTLGEMALSFYKYMAYSQGASTVFMADQPEDNISNNRVNERLVEYFNGLRHRAQVILVTHSPLLVVNQDADNVIVLKRDNSGSYAVVCGCLESEDMGLVMNEVASIMDGGREAILRRVKAYGTIN